MQVTSKDLKKKFSEKRFFVSLTSLDPSKNPRGLPCGFSGSGIARRERQTVGLLLGQVDRFPSVHRSQAAPNAVGAGDARRGSALIGSGPRRQRRITGVDVLADEVDRSVPHHDVTSAGVETAAGPDSGSRVAAALGTTRLVRWQNRVDRRKVAAAVGPAVAATRSAPFAERSAVTEQQDARGVEFRSQRVDERGTLVGIQAGVDAGVVGGTAADVSSAQAIGQFANRDRVTGPVDHVAELVVNGDHENPAAGFFGGVS